MCLAVVFCPATHHVIIDLAANWPKGEGIRGFWIGGGVDVDGHRVCARGISIFRGCIYMFMWSLSLVVCVCVCVRLGSSVTREMDVLASSESLQLVERLRKRRLGSRTVRGEFASVLPWH